MPADAVFRALGACRSAWAGLGAAGLLLGAEPSFQVVTYVQSPRQERQAEAMIASLRTFGGPWREAPVHVVLGDPGEVPGDRLRLPGVQLHPAGAPPAVLALPYALKAWAAAQVETLLQDSDGTLAWFDPETLVLAPPRSLVLGPDRDATVQPAFKANGVALPLGRTPDLFWTGILAQAGIPARQLPEVRLGLEGTSVHAYYNCEVFAVRPRRGILRAWKSNLEALRAHPTFLPAACPDAPHQVFLHQAVLSATLAARVPAPRVAPLPRTAAYPFNLHREFQRGPSPDVGQASTLSGLETLILEQVWEQDPGWRGSVAVEDGQARWLDGAQARYHSLGPGLWREERPEGCNSLLVRTSEGDVLVDSGGTLHPDSVLWRLHQGHPLRAVVLTHGHRDHTTGLGRWTEGRQVPIHGHRSMSAFQATLDRIAPLLERRNARLQGRPPAPAGPLPAHPVLTHPFDTRQTLRCGDTTFELIHVGGETPDTALVWLPERRVLCMADTFYQAFPALSTPRGTQPRPVEQYLRALDLALALEPEVVLPGHGEPVVGRARIQERVRRYRAALGWVFDATLKGLNEGRPVEQLAEEIRLPPDLALPETFGRVAWAVRAIALEHGGGFEDRITALFETPQSTIHPLLVEAAGGAPRIMALAAERLEHGKPLEALHLLDLLRGVPPEARALRIAALRRLQATSRNYFQQALLSAELRELEAPVAQGRTPSQGNPGAPGNGQPPLRTSGEGREPEPGSVCRM